ncbi:MAG: hypothetical protein A2428_17660 [Bdellovibrionales bacterium RIFOXYC1_FULL_54_43]|nr:MAG: hypothetical protein A2428_17660 [Bdellovibrionales bacterium RIFOXYC1_FULL_54_43]
MAIPVGTVKTGRIEAIDFARGVAIALMILSHGIKGLLTFEQMPSWGLVPIHLITKFSSTLFILVFGMSLRAVYLPHVGTPAWPEKRKRLLVRGVLVFFWYKVLTVVEMLHQYPRSEVVDALLYRAFPVYVEILGFYAVALMWLPFALPLWARVSDGLRYLAIVAMGLLAYVLYHSFDFWGIEALKAIFVEDEKHYSWGQLSRGPLVLLGLVIGDITARWYYRGPARLWLAGGLLTIGVALFSLFLLSAGPDVSGELIAIAKNVGKHPPELRFALFTLGGSFIILSAAIAGGARLSALFAPITAIGKNSLQSFVFHVIVIFGVYRYLLGYWHNVSYQRALVLTALLMGLTFLWVKVVHWFRPKFLSR